MSEPEIDRCDRCGDVHAGPCFPVVVLTTGCFDVLHAGHVDCLEAARALGGRLVVAMNDDSSVRALKGSGRPVHGSADRERVLRGLRCVDDVIVFSGRNAARVIDRVQPSVFVKGSDYTAETLDAEERIALERCGAELRFVPRRGDLSTTRVLKRGKERSDW